MDNFDYEQIIDVSSNTTETMTEQETHHVKNKEKCLEKGGSYYERNKKGYVK